MLSHTQDTRMMAIYTPMGKDYLVLRSFTAHEGLSRLFSFELDLLSEDSAINFKEIIGKRVTIRVTISNTKERYFNGFINKFAQIGCDTGLTTYRATMVPWLWFLTQTTDCRIFQNKTVPDIIQQIFKEYGFTDVKVKLQGTYEPREYCVQYRESDYNFVARLMEQYGIFYFFEHEQDKHTMVLADDPAAHQPCPEKELAHWQLPGGGVAPEEDVVTSLQMEQSFRPGKYTLTDYCFETPTMSLLSEVKTTIEVGGNGTYECYDYPGEYAKKKEGEALAKLRMEEEEAKHLFLTGTSNCRAFTSGYRFKLVDYGRHDMDQDYVLTEVRHKASLGDSYTSGGESGGDEEYSNEFTCMPHKVVFRPPQVTPKPLVLGAQTAVVVGPAGEEIYTDKHGRVKVQFHWDREGKRNEDSSCWIRVSQVHAGKGFGGIDIPRIGEEVIVGFLEGVPDQPIIVGRVYNAKNMPPNGLPGADMTSGLKSNSTPGGGGNNCIMMDDTKGNELYSMNAQYNCTEHVGHDRTTTIDNDDTETIKGNASQTVKGNLNEFVRLGKQETILLEKALSVGPLYQITVAGVMNETVIGARTEQCLWKGELVKKHRKEVVLTDKTERVKGTKKVNLGSLTHKIEKDATYEVTGTLSETVKGQHIVGITEAGSYKAKTITLQAEDKLEIVCGSASIALEKSGKIVVKGTDIEVDGGSGPINIHGGKIDLN